MFFDLFTLVPLLQPRISLSDALMHVRRFLLLAPLFASSSAQDLVGFNGTGVYNSSTTPHSLPWNTYNYCNAPHVNKEHWTPVESAELVYVLAVMRHHKRTPDNLFPDESAHNPPSGWDCTNIDAFNHAGPSAVRLTHAFSIPPTHPFASLLWNGTCDVGQLTREGLEDARRHGEDFWGVYGDFVEDVKSGMWVRTSPEERTMWVASALLAGMQPNLESLNDFVVHAEPSTIDSLVPDYPCPAADAVRAAYQSVPAWTDHLEQFAPLAARLGDMLGTRGMSAWETWYDHYFDVFTSRTCHGHPLPCNATTGACVSDADAATVHALGDFEYNYIWNSAQNASLYNSLTFGVLFSELAQNLAAVHAGTEPWRSRVYVGHDGSMVRLAAGLGLGKTSPLRWPALGSEIIMEVWKDKKSSTKFVRVMHEGTPVLPLARIGLDDFIALLEQQVPEDVFGECMGTAS